MKVVNLFPDQSDDANTKSVSSNTVNFRYNFGKYFRLIFGLIVDIIGLASYTAPGAGELTDIGWAFVSSGLIKLMYHESELFGIAFQEEIGIFTDSRMSATIFWQNRYIKEKNLTFQKYIHKNN